LLKFGIVSRFGAWYASYCLEFLIRVIQIKKPKSIEENAREIRKRQSK
jgi:hypothetical protein